MICQRCGKTLSGRRRKYCDGKCRRRTVEEGTGGTAKEYPPQSEIAERSAQVRRRWQWYVERERQQMEFATLKDGRIYVNGEELISEQLLNMHQSTRRARVEDMAATLNRAAREWGRRDVPMEHNDEFRG